MSVSNAIAVAMPASARAANVRRSSCPVVCNHSEALAKPNATAVFGLIVA